MNRSERRRLEKQNRIRNENRKLIDAITQDTENQRVEALMTCFALAMHKEFGFGKKRVLRALRRVDGYMGTWIKDEESLACLKQKVKDEIGIIISC